MTDTSGAPSAEPASAPPGPDAKKAARYATWSRWAGILVGVAALVRLGACFLPATVASCDDSGLQAALKTGIETTTHLKVTGVTDIKTISHTDKTAMCSMHITASEGPPADITYKLDLVKSDTQYQIVDVK